MTDPERWPTTNARRKCDSINAVQVRFSRLVFFSSLLYWSNLDRSRPRIESVDTKDKKRAVVVSGNLTRPVGLSVDVEERMLKAQLALSFTLTMVDEENIR